jgi:glycerate kinase
MARAIGWRFWTADNDEILQWRDLEKLAVVEPPPAQPGFAELIIAVDVANPLLGSDGASRIYGPQKGLRESDMARAEACLARLTEVMQGICGENHAVLPGAGAAGGLGFGLKAFCGGSFRSGGEIFAEVSRLAERIQLADLVITAEGSLDRQTLMGKGVGVVAAETARAAKPCLCLAGTIAVDSAKVPWPGCRLSAIVPEIATLQEALTSPAACLQQLAAREAGKRRLS